MSEPARDLIRLPLPRTSAREIIADVAAQHRLSVAELLSPTRAFRISHARQHAMWELRQRTALSLPQIAGRLGLKDHTTVCHGLRAHERRLAKGRGK